MVKYGFLTYAFFQVCKGHLWWVIVKTHIYVTLPFHVASKVTKNAYFDVACTPMVEW